MKITKTKLKEIIREEIQKLNEGPHPTMGNPHPWAVEVKKSESKYAEKVFDKMFAKKSNAKSYRPPNSQIFRKEKDAYRFYNALLRSQLAGTNIKIFKALSFN